MRDSLDLVLSVGIGGVWIFHGFYSKILDGIPRHRLIVTRILGDRWGGPATKAIGAAECLLGIWALGGHFRLECAVVQSTAIVLMNAIEIRRASDLLISGPGMVLLNAGFLALVWHWALA